MGIFDKFKSEKVITPEDRRSKNNKYIKRLGIACFDDLPTVESSSDVELKDLDSICKRAIACLFSIQLAIDIDQDEDYNESKDFVLKVLKEYSVEDGLSEKEKKLFDKTYSEQDIIDIIWNNEAYWSLLWALGLVNDMKLPVDVCDCEKALKLVISCKNFDEFKNRCKLRNIEDILDMFDLYYRYHWACVENSIDPDTNIGRLNPDVVMERRKGLEWLISGEDDWDEISLDT